MFWVKKEDEPKFNEAVDTLSKIFGFTFAGDMLILRGEHHLYGLAEPQRTKEEK